MLDASYFKSLTLELSSLKNRVRSFISDKHWQTDGEWKESVLRSFLRRNLPNSIQIGRGFVITQAGCSQQIDILIYDSDKPILFRDGDLVFITPDAVLGVIEVKTSLNNHNLSQALEKLASTAQLIRGVSASPKAFGLFSFEDRTTDINTSLSSIQKITNNIPNKVINYICLGTSSFIRFWSLEPDNEQKLLNKWCAYDLPDMAPGYFLHNIIEQICYPSVENNRTLWFPREGKEIHRVSEIGLEKMNDK